MRTTALEKEDLMNTVSTENSRAAVKQLPKFESALMTRKEAAAYLGVSEITLAIERQLTLKNWIIPSHYFFMIGSNTAYYRFCLRW